MKIRQYCPDDYADILEISKYIWEGNDYLPRLINEFYESKYCEPYVVEEDGGKVISIVNMNIFTPDFVWLEAMRTHPEYRNRGIATKLNEYLIQEAKKNKVKELWLSTSKANDATAKMLKKAGFEEITLLKLWDNEFGDQNEQEIDNNKGLKDGTLRNVEYLPLYTTDKTKHLGKSWIPVNDKRDIQTILSKWESVGQKFVHLVNEFNIFPIDSYFVDSWIKEKYIFINEVTDSIMTFKSAKERQNSYVVGIFDLDKDVIVSALLYAYNQIKNRIEDDETHKLPIDIKLFYPYSVDLKLLHSSWVFRIMKKEI